MSTPSRLLDFASRSEARAPYSPAVSPRERERREPDDDGLDDAAAIRWARLQQQCTPVYLMA